MSNSPLIAAPLPFEAALVASTARGVSVHRTGMGPAKARAAARTLASAAGDALLVLGFCGGLDAESAPGEVIVAEGVSTAADEGEVAQRVLCADAQGITAALRARGLSVRSGEIVCVAKLALGPRRAELLAGGALAADMESVWLAAGASGRPFAVVRVVLDSPSHELLRPQAAADALHAARALRRVAATLRSWAPASSASVAGVSASAPAAADSQEPGPKPAPGVSAGDDGQTPAGVHDMPPGD